MGWAAHGSNDHGSTLWGPRLFGAMPMHTHGIRPVASLLGVGLVAVLAVMALVSDGEFTELPLSHSSFLLKHALARKVVQLV